MKIRLFIQKMLVLAILSIVMLGVGCSGSSSNSPSPTPDPPVPPYVEKTGAGNSNNWGFTTGDGTWTYYSFITMSTVDTGIYKVTADWSASPVKIYNNMGRYLMLIDDKLYFVYDGLRRINLDGSGDELILEIEGDFKNITYYDGYFYYIQNEAVLEQSDFGYIWRVKADGTGKEQLTSEYVYTMNVGEGWIFYRLDDDAKLYRMQPDGAGKELISEKAVDFITPYKQRLYFLSYTDNALVSSDLAGGDQKILLDGAIATISHLNILDDYIYISRLSMKHPDSAGVFRLPKAGGTLEALKAGGEDLNFPLLSISGGKVYCLNVMWMGLVEMPFNYYRMNPDGTGFEMMWEE
jgi:hypothetical protein